MIQKSLFGTKTVPVKRKRRQLPKTKKQLNEEILELINRRERQVLVHSCIYYHFNQNIINDATYDRWSHELYSLIQENPDEFKESAHYKDFKDFDGNTGMGLPYDSAFATRVAERLLMYESRNKV